MGWSRTWAEREPRPKVRRLTEKKKEEILQTLRKGIVSSPVLSAFGVQAFARRGRFYLERQCLDEDGETYEEVLGRITPLADTKADLLLESQDRKDKWFTVATGSAAELVKVIRSDKKGTFHGLGSLDASLRRLGKGQERLSVKDEGNGRFVYAETGKTCSVQEALFHYFGLPIEVIAEPSDWYAYHRKPKIIETSKDGKRVLVRFTAETISGGEFSGTCLYAQKEASWGAYPIKPSESKTIADAEAWLVKRKWRAW